MSQLQKFVENNRVWVAGAVIGSICIAILIAVKGAVASSTPSVTEKACTVLNEKETDHFVKDFKSYAGKTVTVKARYSSAYEQLNGFHVNLQLFGTEYESMQVWMSRETPRPMIQYGDIVYVTIAAIQNGDRYEANVVKITH